MMILRVIFIFKNEGIKEFVYCYIFGDGVGFDLYFVGFVSFGGECEYRNIVEGRVFWKEEWFFYKAVILSV